MQQHTDIVRPTLLYIEDKPVNQTVIERILRNNQYDVLIAEDGKSGIDIAIQAQPQLILLDMVLPDMSGAEVFDYLRASEEANHIPVVALAAHTDAVPKIAYKAFGFAGYLAKPIHRGELLSAVRAILGGVIV